MHIKERLFAEIESHREDLIKLTQELVALPTLNPPGTNYLEICEYLKARFERSGFQTELLRAEGAIGDSDEFPRWNIIGRIEGNLPGDCIHFNSHTDVVQVGENWTKDPFGGEIEDGKIYGRGTCDMKGGLAASIIAAESFLAICPSFSGAIEISGTTDEESGGYSGVAWLAEQGRFSPSKVQHVIIPEPLNKNRICLGHRGVWWAEIETKGRIAHGSMPFLGDCAIRHMGAVIQEMEDYLYPLLASKKTNYPIVPEGARQSTMNLNSIHGGEKEQEDSYSGYSAPCVPDRCRIRIDRRFLPEETIDVVKAEISKMLESIKDKRPDFEYSVTDMFSVPSVITEKSAPIVKSVHQSIEEVLGESPDYVISPGTYDQKHIDRIGKLKNCIAYGPGILDLAHQPDEWVGIQDMIDSAKVMACTTYDLLCKEMNS